jgi:hypothetical protein
MTAPLLYFSFTLPLYGHVLTCLRDHNFTGLDLFYSIRDCWKRRDTPSDLRLSGQVFGREREPPDEIVWACEEPRELVLLRGPVAPDADGSLTKSACKDSRRVASLTCIKPE